MRTTLLIAIFFAFACGGDGKDAEEPTTGPAVDTSEGGDEDPEEGMIPVEKFDEIKRTFERKQSQVSRCFVVGVEAGEIEKTAAGVVTVSATITKSGKATNVRIVESSFNSAALKQCVKDYVGRWLFTTLPKDLEYSYQYRLQRF